MSSENKSKKTKRKGRKRTKGTIDLVKKRYSKEMAYLYFGIFTGAVIGVFGNLWVYFITKGMENPELSSNPAYQLWLILISLPFFGFLFGMSFLFFYYSRRS